jgi:proline dehydrogenase
MQLGFARRFVAGERLEEAISASAVLYRKGRRVSLNQLGENVSSAQGARHSRDVYIETVRALDAAGIDGNISIKPTQLGLDFDTPLCLSLVQEIAYAAKSLQRTIEIDMESSAYTERTIQIAEAVQAAHGNLGLALQAYLRRTLDDLDRLAPLRIKIRLVKGAYQEPIGVAFQKKSEVHTSYRRLLDRLFQPGPANGFTAAIATHDPDLVTYASQKITELRVPPDRYEFQMLLGIRRDLQERVFSQGHPLRVYVPWGTAWCPYFMRRLAERPANLWFVLRSLGADRSSAG